MTLKKNKFKKKLKTDVNAELIKSIQLETKKSSVYFKKNIKNLIRYSLPDTIESKSVFAQNPIVFSSADLKKIENQLMGSIQAIRAIPEFVFKNDYKKFLRYIHAEKILEKNSIEEIKNETKFTMCRPDCFWDGQQLFLLEFNTGSAVGLFEECEFLTQYYLKHPALKKFNLNGFFPLTALSKILNSKNQKIGFLEEFDSKTGRLIEDTYSKNLIPDLKARNVDIEIVDFKKLGKLKSKKFDVIYRNFPIDLLEVRSDIWNSMNDYCKSHKAQLFDSPISDLMGNKLLMALMSEKTSLFPEPLQQIISKTIPWTRVLKNQKTQYQNQKSELLHLVSSKKNNFILKKGMGNSGHFVHFGESCTASQWTQLVKRALIEQDWIVQEKIMPPMELGAFVKNDKIVVSDVYRMICPYVLNDQLVGFVSRNTTVGSSLKITTRGDSKAQSGLSTVLWI